ncbi:hypothetical protein Scep_022215 [Stephania cephalantha]|uniref:Uncharacterized protein n=1 Tax=Stephania cephalantha TaxID=152367 RepID=A0AAP0F5Y4_9MAGN
MKKNGERTSIPNSGILKEKGQRVRASEAPISGRRRRQSRRKPQSQRRQIV